MRRVRRVQPPAAGMRPRETSGRRKRGAGADDAEVAGQGQLAAAGDRRAVHGGDGGQRAAGEPGEHPLAEEIEGAERVDVRHLLEVGAGAEGAGPGGADQQHPGAGGLQLGDAGLQGAQVRLVVGVGAPRPVPG